VEEAMMEKKKLLRAFVIVSAGLFVCLWGEAAQAATTIAVGNCKSGLKSYSTIQTAVNNAPAGATIAVCPGTYAEQVTVSTNLTIMGVLAGTADAPTVVPPSGGLVANSTDPAFGTSIAAQILVVSPATSVTIGHLTVDGIGNGVTGCTTAMIVGIYFQNVSGTISQNALRNQAQANAAQDCQNGMGIYVESGDGGTSTVTISNNTVHGYQQNGITANGYGDGTIGPAATIQNNSVIGVGSTRVGSENGIQIGLGATGKVTGNTVIDDLNAIDTVSDSGDASAGILVFASTGITVSGNIIGSTQFGIVTESAGAGFLADNTSVTGNKIIGTQIFDGIDLCSNGNTVTSNEISSSAEAGIHLDSSCASTGNSNTVDANTINEACAGILADSGTSGNTTTPNTMFNVINSVLAGNSCTALQTEGTDAKTRPRSAKRGVARPWPAQARKSAS
jgi:parallel beta-helix repeat protein